MHPNDLPADFFDDSHYQDCGAAHDPEAICVCSQVEREIRSEFSFNSARCY